MTAIPQQTLDFLLTSAPFDQLQQSTLIQFAKNIVVAYFTDENSADLLKQNNSSIFLIRSGQFTVIDQNGLQHHLSEGDYFGVSNVFALAQQQSLQLKVDSAGLIYCLPIKKLRECASDQPKVMTFFNTYVTERLNSDALNDSKSMWLYRTLSEVSSREPICTSQYTSILEGARLMSEHKVSSLLITDNNVLCGIVTDRDIRNRLVAADVSSSKPLKAIMTAHPAQISHRKTLFDALCLMTEHNIHHLPIVHHVDCTPLGMLTASDIIKYQRSSVLFIVEELSKAQSLYDLIRLSWQLPHYFRQHASRLGDFDIAGKVLSQATDIITRRLIAFFEQSQGVATLDYCWVVYGSQARDDQTMGSDQDNSLLLAETPNAIQANYFAELAEYVCQGLGKCGIKLCDGNIMASNPELRLSTEQAIQQAQKWVNQPTNLAIMHCNIFLDARPVAGNKSLFQRFSKQRSKLLKQPLFLAALARHANEVNVPLSVFQKFVYEKNINTADCINLKINAVAIINNLVRIYALENEIQAPATLDRLEQLARCKAITTKDANNMRDIWLFLNRLRWRHQLNNNVADNFVPISDLSSIEKHQLKQAFKAINRSQQAVVLKYSGGMG